MDMQQYAPIYINEHLHKNWSEFGDLHPISIEFSFFFFDSVELRFLVCASTST